MPSRYGYLDPWEDDYDYNSDFSEYDRYGYDSETGLRFSDYDSGLDDDDVNKIWALPPLTPPTSPPSSLSPPQPAKSKAKTSTTGKTKSQSSRSHTASSASSKKETKTTSRTKVTKPSVSAQKATTSSTRYPYSPMKSSAPLNSKPAAPPASSSSLSKSSAYGASSLSGASAASTTPAASLYSTPATSLQSATPAGSATPSISLYGPSSTAYDYNTGLYGTAGSSSLHGSGAMSGLAGRAPVATAKTEPSTALPYGGATDTSSADSIQKVFSELQRDELIGSASAMTRMFEMDEEAVAEMADLAQCSPGALAELAERGLSTTLKAHQSSALRFLVEAEHRRAPQVPSDEEVCLWRAQRFGRHMKWINRANPHKDEPREPKMPRGAILADDMGLGKTLTILCLILSPEDGGLIVDQKRKALMQKEAVAKGKVEIRNEGSTAKDKTPSTSTTAATATATAAPTSSKPASSKKASALEPAPPKPTAKTVSSTVKREASPDVVILEDRRPAPVKSPVKRQRSPDVIILDARPHKAECKAGGPVKLEPPSSPLAARDVPSAAKKIKSEPIEISDDDDLWAQFDDNGIMEIDIDQFNHRGPVEAKTSGDSKAVYSSQDDEEDALWAQLDMEDDDFAILDEVIVSSSSPQQASGEGCKPTVKSESVPDENLALTAPKRTVDVPSKAVATASTSKTHVTPSPPQATIPRSPSPSPAPRRPRASKPTLIVCPLSVLSNWTEQADRHMAAQPFRYALMHGKEMQLTGRVANWNDFDFMLTTYDSLKASRRRLAMLAHHQERLVLQKESMENAEGFLERTEGLFKLSPTWHLAHWQAEVDKYRKSLDDARDKCKSDILLPPKSGGKSDPRKKQQCTERAETLRAQYAAQGRKVAHDDNGVEVFSDDELYFIWTGSRQRPQGERMFAQQWLRVILDEAHVVRNPKTLTYEAVMALSAERRVAVTGTPIVNSTADLGALAGWIGVEPFDHPVKGPSEWNMLVEHDLLKAGSKAVRILRSITKSLVILRTKEMEVNGKPLVDLPVLKSYTYEVDMHPDDFELYKEAEIWLREKLIEWAEDDELQKHRGHIFVVLVRLRQLSDDRRLVGENFLASLAKAMGEVEKDEKGASVVAPRAMTAVQTKLLQESLQAQVECGEVCLICKDSLAGMGEETSPPVIGRCGHGFHADCIKQRMLANDSLCPAEGRPLGRVTDLVSLPTVTAEASGLPLTKRDSSKIEAIVKIVNAAYDTAPNDKTIIFSNFVGFLQLVGKRLEKEGVPFVTIFGSHSKKKRDEVLASFNRPLGVTPVDDGGLELRNRILGSEIPRVILMSMGAGSVGLNMTIANHVVLADPWYNEAIQMQAVNRAHRIGQTKEVRVHRLVSKDTIEKRVVDIATEKLELASFALSGVKHKGKSVYKATSNNLMRDIGAIVGMDAAQRVRFAAASRR